MHKLSVVIITKNESKNIIRCLESVKPIADEIVVVDSGSEDDTVARCQEFGCNVIIREFDGFGKQKQYAVDHAKNNWILSVDADEEITPELQDEIASLLDQKVIPESGFEMRRYLVYQKKILKHGGAGSDFQLRLFNRNNGKFTLVEVHESIQLSGQTGKLTGKMLHYSYLDLTHHFEKINFYSTRAAKGYRLKGKSFPKIWIVMKFPISFVQFYLIKKGFLDGYAGFIWSFLAAVYSMIKLAKTQELIND